MIKIIGTAVVAAAMLVASPAFAGGKSCCASNTKTTACADFDSLNVTADQKSKLVAWQSECEKAGCTKDSQAKFLKQAKGILSAKQYAKLKTECAKTSKKSEA
jgi:hypothetical protein